ncbi:MAG: hypothetical protein AB7P17_01585 [Nitrospirales bacterium]
MQRYYPPSLVRLPQNGQAAFLFLLTSTFALPIRLSSGQMVWMALPYYTGTMTCIGLLDVYILLPSVAHNPYPQGLLTHQMPVMAKHLPDPTVPLSFLGGALSK